MVTMLCEATVVLASGDNHFNNIYLKGSPWHVVNPSWIISILATVNFIS